MPSIKKHKKSLSRPGYIHTVDRQPNLGTTKIPPSTPPVARALEPARVRHADKKAIEWASSGYEAIPLFGRRGQIRSNGRCDVGWKGYPSWEAGLVYGGEAGKRCELGEGDFLVLAPSGDWEASKKTRQQKEDMFCSAVPSGYSVPYIMTAVAQLHKPRLEGLPCPNPAGPTPLDPRPWLSSGHVDVASPLTFRPKISPGQSHNIIIITD